MAKVKRTGVVILISEKKTVTKDIKMKWPIHQEAVTIITFYAANNRAPKYIKQKKDSSAITETSVLQFNNL